MSALLLTQMSGPVALDWPRCPKALEGKVAEMSE